MKAAVYMYIGGHLGGAERRLIRIFSYMPNNIQAEILLLEGKEKQAQKLIEPFLTDRSTVKIFSNILFLIYYLIRNRFDWVVGFTPGGRFILISLLAWLFHIKRLFLCVQTSSSSLIFGKTFSQRLYKVKFFSCVKLASVLDCLYPSALEKLQKRFPYKRIEITSNSFTDLDKFRPAEHKCKYIVFASTFIPDKNIDLFVFAIDLIQTKIRELGYRCYLCGDGPLLLSLQKMVIDVHCADIIEFTGRIRMESILPQSRMFCSLQSINNYPSQSLIEAIACGCYCIATNCGDTDLLVKKEFGQLVEITPEDIAEAILNAMYFNDIQWGNIKQKAHDFANNKCNIKTSVDYFMKILTESSL